MSNPILSSNQSSAVVATINESTTKNPWVYNETDRLTVPHALQLLTVQHSSGTAAANSTITFDLPKNGLLQQLWLKLTGGPAPSEFGQNTDDVVVEQMGMVHTLGFLRTISSIRLTASGRIIEKLDQQQILARYADLPVTQRTAVQDALRMAGTADGDAANVVAMPLPFYFSRDQQRYGLLTNFEEPFRVEIQFGSDDDFKIYRNDDTFKNQALEAAATGTVTKAELIGHYRQLDEPQMNEVVSKNYGDGLLSRIVDISKREAPYDIKDSDLPSTGHRTSQVVTRVPLKENEAVRAMYVFVTPTADATDTIRAGAPIELDNIELRFNNTSVINAPASLIRYFGRWGQSTHLGDGVATNLLQRASGAMQYVYKIDFGLATDKGLSNVVAMREISAPELVVTFRRRDTNQGGLKVHVVYDTATFLSTSSSTGRVQLSISS